MLARQAFCKRGAVLPEWLKFLGPSSVNLRCKSGGFVAVWKVGSTPAGMFPAVMFALSASEVRCLGAATRVTSTVVRCTGRTLVGTGQSHMARREGYASLAPSARSRFPPQKLCEYFPDGIILRWNYSSAIALEP